METADLEALNNIYIGLPLTIAGPAGELTASLHVPMPDVQNDAVVILLHGLAGTRHEHNGIFMRLAAALALDGFTVLRFDFRGCGESFGTSLDIYPSAQVEDTFAVIDYLLKQGAARSCHLLGFSLGGVVAALCARKQAELFDSLTLWETPFDLARELKRIFGPMHFDRIRARGYLQAGLTKLGPQLFAELTQLDIKHGLGNYKGGVLLVSGEHDLLVPLEPNHGEWLNALSAAQTEDLVVTGADHGFSKRLQEEAAISRTKTFLLEQEAKKSKRQASLA